MDRAAPSSLSLPPLWLSGFVAVAAAWLSWPLYGLDTQNYLLPWLAHIEKTGPIAAFAVPFGNYTPPYLYLLAAVAPLAQVVAAPVVLKTLSFACLAVLAASLRRLFAALGVAHASRAAALVVLAPTLFVSPAVLVQCDALWAAALVMGIVAAIDRRHAAMFAWCGLTVAIKVQAVFAGPFILSLALARRVPLRCWFAALAAAMAAMLPAWLAGWPALDLLTIYWRQSQWGEGVALNAPNLWTIAGSLGVSDTSLHAVAMAATMVAAAAYVMLLRRRLATADPAALVHAALLSALLIPGLLPQMHERYFFLSDVLALVLAVRIASAWRIALLTQLGSGLAIFAYLSGIEAFATLGAAAMIAATWLTLRSLQEAVRVDVDDDAHLLRPVELA